MIKSQNLIKWTLKKNKITKQIQSACANFSRTSNLPAKILVDLPFEAWGLGGATKQETWIRHPKKDSGSLPQGTFRQKKGQSQRWMMLGIKALFYDSVCTWVQDNAPRQQWSWIQQPHQLCCRFHQNLSSFGNQKVIAIIIHHGPKN